MCEGEQGGLLLPICYTQLVLPCSEGAHGSSQVSSVVIPLWLESRRVQPGGHQLQALVNASWRNPLP